MHRYVAGIATLVAAIALFSAPVLGEPAVRPGERAYLRLCARCHGPAARGMPSGMGGDLTHLSQRLGTPLPRPWMLDLIAGKAPLPASSMPDVTACGAPMLRGVGPDFAVMRRGTLLEIIAYLDTRQVGG